MKTYTYTLCMYKIVGNEQERDRQQLSRAELKLVKITLSATKLFVFTTLGI